MSQGPRNSRFVTTLFLMVFLVAVAALGRLLWVFSSALIAGLVLVSLSEPMFRRLLPRVGGRRQVAALLSTLLVLLGVLLPLVLVLSALTSETVALYQRLTGGEHAVLDEALAALQSDHPLAARARQLAAAVGLDPSPAGIRAYAAGLGATAAGLVVEQLRGVAANAFQGLVQVGLTVVVMLELFVHGPRLKAYLWDLSPLPEAQEEMLAQRFAQISRAVFLGNGVSSVVQGVLGGAAFYLFGIGSGVLWGSAMAFSAFLPIVGSAIVFVPAAGYLALRGDSGLAIGFTIFQAVHVGILEYAVKPRLIGGQSHMNGVLVFLGVLAGLSVFGIAGLFYGPLILTMFLTLAAIYKAEYRADLTALISPWARADGGEAPPTPRVAPEAPRPETTRRAAPLVDR